MLGLCRCISAQHLGTALDAMVYKLRVTLDESHLIGIKDADNFVGWDRRRVRVDLAQAVVQVGRFSVHLPLRPLPPADIHHFGRPPKTPLALLLVLAIITQVHCARAASRQRRIQSSLCTVRNLRCDYDIGFWHIQSGLRTVCNLRCDYCIGSGASRAASAQCAISDVTLAFGRMRQWQGPARLPTYYAGLSRMSGVSACLKIPAQN